MATSKKSTKKAAPRWTAKRKADAKKKYDMGASASDAAKELKLPKEMVEELFEQLDEIPPGGGTEEEDPPEEEEEETEQEESKEEAEEEADPPPKKANPTKKKAAKKAPAKKKGKRGRKKAAAAAPPSKKERLRDLISSVNTHMKADVLRFANDTDTSYLLRRPTGLLSLDIALAGGWPAGSFCVTTGSASVGKDYQLGLAFANQQRIYGDDCRLALWNNEFKLDKMFFREKCGVKVALTGEEIDELREVRERLGHPALTPAEEEELTHEIGEFVLVQGTLADHALDAIIDMLHSNLFNIIGINSLGNLQTVAKEGTESLSEFAQQSNEAILISKFFPKFFAYLNAPGEDGEKNMTTVLATNQVRAKRDGRSMPGRPKSFNQKYQSALQANTLNHGKAIELTMQPGSPVLDKSVKPPVILGREIRWELTKGKLGTHDGIKGSYHYYYDDGADMIADVVAVATSLGVLDKSSAWYSFEDENYEEYAFRAQGVEGVRRHLINDPALVEVIRDACLQESGIMYRYS